MFFRNNNINTNSVTEQIASTFALSFKYTLANVRLRKSNSTTSEIITVIPEGSRVLILDTAEDWSLVAYNNQRGYVYNIYLSVTKYAWRELLLRSYASAESNPVTIVPARSEVQVLSVIGEWSYAVFNDQRGYIFSYFLTDDGNPPQPYDFTYFSTDMTRFVNDNGIKSPTVNLITTDLENKYTYVFARGGNGLWEQLYQWQCTVGKPSTPTIQGTFYINGRKPYFGTDVYRVKYATRIKGSYYYHSILFNAEGTEVINDVLGQALSHGCIRLAIPNAQWIYDNVLDSSAVVIH